jgi:glycosyltransferase involved in cell wall biosynthesis
MSGLESAVNLCVIVPAYCEQGRIGAVVRGIRRYCERVLVVDDGSTDATGSEAERSGAEVVRHATNRGKGVALESGFAYARSEGVECVVTMDADGQHDPADLPRFIECYARTGAPVIIGSRMHAADSMPFVRRMTNRFMSWLLSRRMKQKVPDTQSGYRLYSCDVLEGITVGAERFAAESEILLTLAAKGVRMASVPIRVIYRDERSKISPFRDTLRFFGMLARYGRHKQEGDT